MYRVKEPKTNLKEELISKDTNHFVEICMPGLSVKMSSADVKDTTRIGRKREDSQPSPL